VAEAFGGLPWVLAERRLLPAEVERQIALLDAVQLRTGSRRYVS
jgi:hypothetical protein